MKVKHYIALAALTLPLAANAQSNVIDFESQTGYKSVGVFDTWENSPFRTGVLKGNVKVVNNPNKANDDIIGQINPSEKVLAFQRSRFGSNTFGVRVELTEPIALSQTAKYVHVMMLKPKAGRVMCFALGSRADRPNQSKEVVQVEASCISIVKTDGKWYDAVFALTGAEGVNVHSLVFAPEVESQHNATSDYAVYIDNIQVDNSSTSRIIYGCYPVNYEKTQKLNRTDRYATGIMLKSADGDQSLSVSQQSDRLLFQDLLAKSFKAKAGEKVSVNTGYKGTWMSAYVYLDRDNNGKFNFDIKEDGTPAENSDLMSYSHYKKKNSAGATLKDGNTRTLPEFTIPAGLEPGFYRLRYKIDWDEIDPAGNTTESNNIVGNGGAIIDTRLNIHGDEVTISRGQSASGTNGEMQKADGTAFSEHKIKFGEAYKVKFVPSPGFKLGNIVIRHGYNLDKDSLVNETPQYVDVVVPAYMAKDNIYTIPAEYIDGDVRITPNFISTESGETEEKYGLNFPKDLAITRTDRALNSVAFSTVSNSNKQKITITNPSTVYQDYTSRKIYVKSGEAITTDISYKAQYAPYMHAYLYVDLNGDGTFSTDVNANGTPATSGEMLSYTYANGKNSKGQNVGYNDASADQWGSTNSIPQFSLPAGLPNGKYRARLKIDWDSTDPKGHYGEGVTSNLINDNGGYILDFDFDVVDEIPTNKLEINTTNGSIVGANNAGLPETVTPESPLTVMAYGLDENYVANEITVRHGENLDGEQVVNGKTMWEETTIELNNGTATIPGELIDGDVRLTANFVDMGSEYKLAFGDEFNTADNSQPDSKYWSRSGWAHPTWKRYTAQTTEGQLKTGWIEDGKLVLRCVKNNFDAEVDGKGNKLEMISGAVETANKVTFTYGKVEGRLKTTAHSGNFPAFWMMPNTDTYGGWPSSGEIDIFEQINNENKSYHTIHTHWANGAGDGGLGHTSPAKGGTSVTTTGEYHVYGMEWTENLLKWFVDGKQVFSYAKSTDQDAIKNLQWPFDKPFYLILNQSVGNGSWAANRDLNFTYETKFDWVRVYQKADGDLLTGINAAKEVTLDYYITPGQIRLVAPYNTKVTIVDLQGRTLFAQVVQGNKNVYVPSGVYLVNNNKVIVP
uniref:glycoside hydrolase family 16 protein n=1 Tax=Alloprevotella sp. TaxID=1872471 RepID=UPI003FF1223F